ncbi:ABC transporter permease subunit [Cellulomonas endophytica]|uniref:ABC transporter permease subunit n=1 Tax=Cellulomonas endophytica TaxID=2494735 RepID=UPI0013E96748|nr:ABC transporter permease subunit [Cellulomonas endophytica]
MTAPAGTVLGGELAARRRTLALWCLSLAAVTVLYTSFYPSVGGSKADALLANLPADVVTALGFDDLGTAAGYVSSTVFSLLGAVLTLVCTIGLGAGLVAGAEEDGTLELELAAPVSRSRVYLERLALLWLAAAALATTVVVVLGVLALALDLDLTPGRLAAAGLALALFGGALGTVALGLGAATGRRAVALAGGAALAVLGYVLAYVGPLVDGAGWVRHLSPYDWYIGAEPLATGVDERGGALLVALAVLAGALGLVVFRRRDLLAQR